MELLAFGTVLVGWLLVMMVRDIAQAMHESDEGPAIDDWEWSEHETRGT